MRFVTILAAALTLAGCINVTTTTESGQESAPPPEPTADAIEAHIRFLADDLLEGREAGEPGYDRAALYVETQFRLMGLEPGGSDGYYAPVPLMTISSDPDRAAMSVDGDALTLGEDFLVSPHAVKEESAVEAEAVFVGYGIDAPSLGYDDYAGVDVEGRIAVALSGTPEGLPSDVAAHLNSTRTRAAIAADAGAAALVLIPAEGLTRFPFARLAQFANRPSTTTPAASAGADLEATAMVSEAAAARLFANAPQSFETVVAAARAGESLPTFPLETTVSIAQATRRETIDSANVIGVLPGSDPALAGETVVVTAHLDHLGVCQPLSDEDRICNGALDNASGVAIMLETARAMAAGPGPRRSVAFVALTAEEKGLLGSAHLAANPTPAMGEMVANVNLDMPVIRYEFADMVGFGAEHSSLGPLTEAAVARAGAALSPDPMPEQSLFVRSDHYNFVREGVPSIFLMTGFASPDPEDDEGQGFRRFLGGDYHGPGDEAIEGLVRYDQGAKFARINYEIITAIADADERPRWNEDSYFGDD
ncbi:aminopeptidase [Marinicauda salina]|uniref:Aminopeptidase n=1 Tax=Marinicauda salina TaxID=2135793 RepID=A0A2U2BU37_9PROT|nr:M28 family metallopeptidase [Marinicauda salina]PWE17507.1 aminopeptidase [Marinicauda salina]